ncbi:ImmA/IrrE family metallo-endopeptidase [Treponema sp.]|uniref:ImmA/IrrE family metallo-endopeptidase n=1 Tax=Treponema sp. TaxID=166 RepID=UPI003FA263DE
MPVFKINEEKIETIAKELKVDKDVVALLSKHYTKIQNGMKEQYLAHIIRTMEVQLQELTENQMFKIIVDPVPLSDTNFTARAQYQQGQFFWICYPSHLDDIQLRVYLAHELGHLYLVEYINNIDKTANLTEKSNMEPLSTVFGILAILDKNDFYSTISKKKLLHKTWESVIDDFKQLAKKNKGLYNIS